MVRLRGRSIVRGGGHLPVLLEEGERVKRILSACCAVAAVVVAVFTVPAYASPAEGEWNVVDRVIAVVEDKALLMSELELEYKRYMMQVQRTDLSPEEEKRIRQEVLDGLVANLLMSVHAEKVGIEIPDDEIDSSLENVIDENKRALGGEEAFNRQLEREGMTIDQLRSMFREKIKVSMLIDRLMRREVMSDLEVTEGETKRYYTEHLSELPKRPETVRLAHILIAPKASEALEEKALERILEAQRKVLAGEDFAEVAREFSDDPSAGNGGSLGYIVLEDLNSPAFETAARKLTVGETSDPVLTQFGYHLIKLEDVSGEKVLIRHILARVEGGEEDVETAAELADSIRQELLAGGDFGEMAARYSADPNTKDSGGEVGEIPLENLPGFFREMIKDVPDGEIAQVMKEPKGFRIVKVLGRSPQRTFTFEESREELMRLIEQEKRQERYKDYVEGLKNVYYCEVKGDL